MSDQMRLLLDKSVIRRYFEGVSTLARDQELTEEQQQIIILVHLTSKMGGRLFISQEAHNLIRAHSHELAPGESLMFLRRVEILYPARYFKRWARRLRQRTFTREDARLLALGSFGTDAEGNILGADVIVTLDQAMLCWTLRGGTGSQSDPELTGRENIRFASTARRFAWACGGPRSSASSTRPVLSCVEASWPSPRPVLSAVEVSNASWTRR